jgi:hypothetical protein
MGPCKTRVIETENWWHGLFVGTNLIHSWHCNSYNILSQVWQEFE